MDWADYPASAGIDGAELLGRPDQEDMEGPARELMLTLRSTIENVSGLRLVPTESPSKWFSKNDWFVEEGNGYGGESMLVTVNCCSMQSDAAPDPLRWRAVLDAASEVTRAAGLGPLTLTHESKALAADPAWEREYRDQYCNMPNGECWMWSADVFDGSQWVFITIQDGALDPTGRAVRDATGRDGPVAFIALDYGATVVKAGMSQQFADALAPFAGLERPAASTSD